MGLGAATLLTICSNRLLIAHPHYEEGSAKNSKAGERKMRMPRIAEIWRNKRGNVMILTAMSMPLLMGSAGLAVDTIQWTLWKRQLQRMADSAALSGAFARGQSKDVHASVRSYLSKTSEITLSADPRIENGPSAGPYAGDNRAVRVAVESSRALPFSSFFLSSPQVIQASATAALISGAHHCVIALDKNAVVGIQIQGNATLDLRCGMASNTSAANAVSAGGSTSVIATPITAVGGLQASGSYIAPTKLEPYSLPQPDPFASLPTPSVSGCMPKISVSPSESVTLAPGCYKGMDIKGTAAFTGGVYSIDGGTVSFGSQANVSGTGVTFVLTSDNAASAPSSIAGLDINGGATLDLTAPTSGTYAGVLFYQDRRAVPGEINKINGNASSRLQGAFYFPGQTLEFTGTAGMDTECVQLIAWHVNFSGNSSIVNECPAGYHPFIGTRVRLVA